MPDSKDKNLPGKGTIKVEMKLLLAMKNEQNRRLNKGNAVSLSDLANEAWECYRKSPMEGTREIPSDIGFSMDVNYTGITPLATEFPWIQGLLKVLRGKNADARNAIMTNIVAFTGYSALVPEIADGELSVDALEARLATYEQQLVDARKNIAVAGARDAPEADNLPPGKARKRRTGTQG